MHFNRFKLYCLLLLLVIGFLLYQLHVASTQLAIDTIVIDSCLEGGGTIRPAPEEPSNLPLNKAYVKFPGIMP